MCAAVVTVLPMKRNNPLESPATYRVIQSPVGRLRLGVRDRSLVELSFWRARGEASQAVANDEIGTRLLDTVEFQLAEYFAGRRKTFEVPLQLEGTDFHRRVWAELLKIPYARTLSYGELAAKVGVPELARAVGAANGANPIAIIVPCHRVIGSDGTLIGYGGGLERKRLLLDLESGSTQLAFG